MNKIYWKHRWNTIAFEIRFLFLVSFFLILIIEFGLSWFTAFNEFCYKFGQFVLKLSYSFTSASIFYFLVQHMPKERKRIKLHNLLSYKIHNIESQITILIKNLFGDKESSSIKEMSFIKCSNLLAKLIAENKINVSDIYIKGIYSNDEYFKITIINILKYCDEVLEYNEYLDTKVVHGISRIKSFCEIIMRLNIHHGGTLRKYDFDFYNIIQNKIELGKAISVYSKNYHSESKTLSLTFHKAK